MSINQVSAGVARENEVRFSQTTSAPCGHVRSFKLRILVSAEFLSLWVFGTWKCNRWALALQQGGGLLLA